VILRGTPSEGGRASGCRLSSKIRITVLLRVAAALLAAVVPGCDESLPPRDDPQGYLQANLAVVQGTVTVDLDGRITNAGVFTLTVRNNYNEVLQAGSLLEGEVQVWLRDDPNQRAIVHFDRSDLINWWIAAGGQTTLRPDSPAVFAKQWSHMTIAGEPFWKLVPMTPMVTDHGVPYCQSNPVHLAAEGSVRLFKNIAPVNTAQIAFTLVYNVFGISCD
jgi:hypothetical protein